VSSTITDTLYDFENHAGGDFYYQVRGSNSSWGWGYYSSLAKAEISFGIEEGDVVGSQRITPSIALAQNPIMDRVKVRYVLGHGSENTSLRVYDSSGRLVVDLSGRLFDIGSPSYFIWDCRDDKGRLIPNGIYFIRFTADETRQVIKAVILR
jgi:flagellar hook assembly protein FlgD